MLEEVFVRNHLSNFESPPELFGPQRDHWKKSRLKRRVGWGGVLYCKTQVKKKYYLPEDSEGVLVVLDIMSFLLVPVKCF